MPKLSLIVCTLGRTEPLVRLLTSLRCQTLADVEVLVVDQNEPGYLDGIVGDVSDALGIIHLRSPRGLSRARNVGLAHCTGAVIGFPDDDCWYAAGVLDQAHDFFARHAEIAVLMGRTVDRSGRESLTRHRAASGAIDRSNVFQSGTSNTLFVRREAAVGIGGFDETLGVGAATPFQSGEETDFVLRCVANGHRAHYERDFCVFHDQIDHAGRNAARARTYAVGFGRLMRTHNYGIGFLGLQLMRAAVGGVLCLARADLAGARRRRDRIIGSLEGYVAPLPRPAPQPPRQA